MACERVKREVDDFANSGFVPGRKPLINYTKNALDISDRKRVAKYYDQQWKEVLRQIEEDKAIECFL